MVPVVEHDSPARGDVPREFADVVSWVNGVDDRSRHPILVLELDDERDLVRERRTQVLAGSPHAKHLTPSVRLKRFEGRVFELRPRRSA